MMNNVNLERLQIVVNSYNELEQDKKQLIIERLKKNEPHGAVYSSFSTTCIFNGLYALVSKNNIKGLKQWFYVSSLLRVESCKYSGGWGMWTPHAFIFPLLTDNLDLIKTYSALTTVNDNDHHKSLLDAINYPKEGRFEVLRFQAILRKDWDVINQMKKMFLEKVTKPKSFNMWEIDFYDALQNKNAHAAKEIIQEYLNPKIHKYLNQHLVEEFSGDIWSHHPVMFTKLAWMNGLEIEIDHPLVPMELMPIKPLDHYDFYYEFLDPAWKPKGFFERLLGHLKK